MSNVRTAAILFGGIGGASLGLMESKIEAYGKVHSMKILCSIDFDPVACRNHDLLTGEATALQMDLFSRDQYIDFFGQEPADDWREMTPWDIWVAFGYQVPDYIFLSPPCKGFSGLLPEKSAKSQKYQALNKLTLRGLDLVMQACLEYGGELPAFVHFENVPRMQTRGKAILAKVRKLLEKYGFAINMRGDHNLGVVGGLGQNRLRFLILARNEARVPNFVYLPPKKALKTIGDVIGPLPMPGDTAAGGPMHRLPNLEWKTWVRLALIRAGGDWRDLQNLPFEQYRIEHVPRGGAYGVENWDDTARTVTGTAGPGRSNGAAAVSDPRLAINGDGKTNLYRVQPHNDPASCVTGAVGPSNGAACISDPKLTSREGRHPGVYRVVSSDEPAPCVTGTRFGSGALAISDPRVQTKLMPDSYGVQDWDQSAKAVRGATRIMNSPASISDPRLSDREQRRSNCYPVRGWNEQAHTVTGEDSLGSGAPSVADVRLSCSPRSGTMGVMRWDETAKTVIGSGDIHAGAAAIADPRQVPADKDRGIWMIIAEDGTWHRPLTTYELAMLQDFPTHLPDGRPFQLEGCSDAKAREYIGNAVPRAAATAMGNVMLIAMAEAEAGIGFSLSWEPVWVAPSEDELPAVVH